MTREEILAVLRELYGAYANAPKDSKATVRVWEMMFGSEDARVVAMAARLHMKHSSFFPAPNDLRKEFGRAKIMIDMEAKAMNIEPPKAPAVVINPDVSFCDLCGLCDRKNQELCEF